MEERGFPVCVENIATEAKTADLRKIFAQFGEVVEVTIVSNYGFVLYMDPDEAISAIRKGTGETLCGQKLEVKPTEELERHFKGKVLYVEFMYFVTTLSYESFCDETQVSSVAKLNFEL